MIDVSMLPEAGEKQVIEMTAVPANQMTIAQQRMAQAIWQSIQLARQDTRILKEELYNLEVRFDSQVAELNNSYKKITQKTKRGMQFLYKHLQAISIQASQFSGLVHQQFTQTTKGDAKIVALQVTNQSNKDNLEILAQSVPAETTHRQ